MKNKIEIQKEIDDLLKQIGSLTTRRSALRIERGKILAGEDEKIRRISESLLNGSDVEKESTALERDKGQLTALNNAIDLAEARLSELSVKSTNLKRDLAMVDFERLADDADELALACIPIFQAAVDANNALREKFAELAQVAPAAGQNVNSDRLKTANDLNLFFGDVSTKIKYNLTRIETEYSAQMKVLRQKKSR